MTMLQFIAQFMAICFSTDNAIIGVIDFQPVSAQQAVRLARGCLHSTMYHLTSGRGLCLGKTSLLMRPAQLWQFGTSQGLQQSCLTYLAVTNPASLNT